VTWIVLSMDWRRAGDRSAIFEVFQGVIIHEGKRTLPYKQSRR